MANPYVNFGEEDRYDIFTVRAIVRRLGRESELQAIETEMFAMEHMRADDDNLLAPLFQSTKTKKTPLPVRALP